MTELKCETCGHRAGDHVRLPGHPDGAEECYGTDDCECGHFLSMRAARLTAEMIEWDGRLR